MTVRFEVDRPYGGLYGVTLPCYKWGYTEIDREHTKIDLGTTPMGVHYEERKSYATRQHWVRFVEDDATLEQLATLSFFAQRLVRTVRYYPAYDTAPGTFWNINWQTEVVFERILDNRRAVELRVVEESVAV